MFWLVSQILGWVLLGALAGGLIGWALRCRKSVHETEGLRNSLAKAYADKPVVEPEEYRVSGGINNIGNSSRLDSEKYAILLNQLEAEKEEVAGLKAKLALAGATGQGEPKQVMAGLSVYGDKSDLPAKDGQLTWRNRYLESRVRFLENKVSDLEAIPQNNMLSSETNSEVRSEQADNSDMNDKSEDPDEFSSIDLNLPEDAVLEEVSTSALSSSVEPKVSLDFDSVTSDSDKNPNFESSKTEDELVDVQSLIWRNRYLEGRVRYLEEDNQEDEVSTSKVSESDTSDEDFVTQFYNSDLAVRNAEPLVEQSSVISNENDTELERLRWRARYLEGRVKFLEENLAESELRFEKDSISPVLESIAAASNNSESSDYARAQWRNDYLEEKLRYAQQVSRNQEVEQDHHTVVEPTGLTQSSLNERSQWRELYLQERIRYSEEAVGIAKLKKSPAQEYVTDIEMDRLRWRSHYLEERLRYAKSELEELKATKIRVRSSFVEKAVSQSKVDNSELTTELARLKWREVYYKSLNARLSSQKGTQSEEDGASIELNRLSWKNHYLRSRVKFLEQSLDTSDRKALQLSEELKRLENDLSHMEQADSPYGDESETARLKWRNSYLMGRIGYLEEGKSDQSFVQPASIEKPGDALDNIEALSEFRAIRSFVGKEVSETEETEIFLNLTSTVRSQNDEKLNRKRTGGSKKRSERKKRKATRKSIESIAVETKTNEETFHETFRTSEYFVEGDTQTGRPAYLTQPLLGTQDDLREIAGVGPKIERILHDLGIYHFYQIAAWTRREVEWVDNYLTFKGRIDRENWIDQSKKLARGEETDGQRKYRSGKHI